MAPPLAGGSLWRAAAVALSTGAGGGRGVAGVVFSVLRYRCHTLWAPVLAHRFDDTIGFVWFFLFGPF
jgi:hypothetical protein